MQFNTEARGKANYSSVRTVNVLVQEDTFTNILADCSASVKSSKDK